MIYADYNATTPISRASRQAMERAYETWGNPSSTHAIGRKANEILEDSRRIVSKVVCVDARDIAFTSGGSEANTTVLLGSLFLREPLRLLTSKTEHSSIKDVLPLLRGGGATVDFVDLLPSGSLNLDAFEKKITEFKPNLISLMAANNETGIIFPMKDIFEIAKAKGVKVHTDAVQAFGKTNPLDWNMVDFMSISAHKIYGPKGCGALIVKDGIKLVSTHYGGSQELKRRGGTQNMVGIAGFGGACETISDNSEFQRLNRLRNRFEDLLTEKIDGIYINGKNSLRIPNTSNLRIGGITSDIFLSALDLDGVQISAGSACFSGSVSPSHVLLAMGLSHTEAQECMRISFGKDTTDEHIDTLVQLMVNHTERIRLRRKSQ